MKISTQDGKWPSSIVENADAFFTSSFSSSVCFVIKQTPSLFLKILNKLLAFELLLDLLLYSLFKAGKRRDAHFLQALCDVAEARRGA